MALGVGIRIDVSDLEGRLEAAQVAFGRREWLELIGARWLLWVDENFRAGGLERPWVPLARSTLAGRRAGGAGARPLRDRGRLAQSFVSAVTRGQEDRVQVGTADERAPRLHAGTPPRTLLPRRRTFMVFETPEGTRFARRVEHPGLPARPLLPSERAAEDMAVQVLTRTVDEILRREGLGGATA
jgi:hypothetical protein